jgi:hypothetical protein
LRICANRSPDRIPVCAFAQVAVRTGFPFAHLRKSQSEQDSRLRICASRSPNRIPVCAFAQVAVRTGFLFAHLRKSQSGQDSRLRICASRSPNRKIQRSGHPDPPHVVSAAVKGVHLAPLTAGSNCRRRKVPQGRHLTHIHVSSRAGLAGGTFRPYRKLKHTVNKVLPRRGTPLSDMHADAAETHGRASLQPLRITPPLSCGVGAGER